MLMLFINRVTTLIFPYYHTYSSMFFSNSHEVQNVQILYQADQSMIRE
jgi:hypothetical protein